MIRDWVRRLADQPVIFDCLRWLLEGGHAKHRELIERNLGAFDGQVLDCGCGTGIYASCFSPGKYVGIDISPTYVARCISRYPNARFHVMDATRMTFDDQSFGAAIISGVLHHLDDAAARRVCHEVRRVLQPGGWLLAWEDIPTRSRWNWLGAAVHRLDLGEHIRTPAQYESILETEFAVADRRLMRSGFMDYAAFVCTKSSASGCEPKEGVVDAENADFNAAADRSEASGARLR